MWAAKLASPDYGDIILVMDDDTNLVKRAVGFAGDRLWMERDNSEPGSKWYLCRKKSGSDEIERLAEERYGDSVMPRFDLEIETCHLITNNVGEGAFDEQTAFVVPENCVFALGDNRNISSDSRSRGAFPMEDVIGVVKAKGMGLVYAVIAVLAVLLAVFLVADAVKTKERRLSESDAGKRATKARTKAARLKRGNVRRRKGRRTGRNGERTTDLKRGAMRVKSISVNNFRNLSPAKITPDGGLNLILGDNAQGKTNLLESVCLCCLGKSPRTDKEREMINYDADFARVNINLRRATEARTLPSCFQKSAKSRCRQQRPDIEDRGAFGGISTPFIFRPTKSGLSECPLRTDGDFLTWICVRRTEVIIILW